MPANLLLPYVLLSFVDPARLTQKAGGDTVERMVHYEVLVAAPAARVWEAWSTPAGLEAFFAPKAIVELKPFGHFQILFDPSAPPGERGAENELVLAVQPGHMLTTTWGAPPFLPVPRARSQAGAQRTFLVVTLVPKGNSSTLVSITNTGYGRGGEWDESYDYFRGAWVYVAAALQYRFEVGPVNWKQPPDLTQRMTQIGGEIGPQWLAREMARPAPGAGHDEGRQK
jgi:uncharacterized protein YndB with AHSA1/START domain